MRGMDGTSRLRRTDFRYHRHDEITNKLPANGAGHRVKPCATASAPEAEVLVAVLCILLAGVNR